MKNSSQQPDGGDDRPQQITRLLNAAGDGGLSPDLLPLVYDELRSLARARMAATPPGNTLQPTALVHEAYLRLLTGNDREWSGRGHFFAAAAEAMRQILVEQVRRKKSLKRGGDRKRVELDDVEFTVDESPDQLLRVHEGLATLEARDVECANIVKLRYFAGFTRSETSVALGIPLRTLDRKWRYAVARLQQATDRSGENPDET